MICHRCSGLMVREEFDDVEIGSGCYEPVGWRCVNCGAIVDTLIAANRRRELMPVTGSQARQKGDHELRCAENVVR